MIVKLKAARMPQKRKNPANRNITRIESKLPADRVPVIGWEVRIYRGDGRFNQFFSDKAHGGKSKALEAARAIRDKMEKQIKPYTRRELADQISVRNTSGHRGVRLRTTIVVKAKKKYIYKHVEASWTPEPGKVIKETFSVERLGLKEAWRLALECREKAVAKIKG